MLYFMTRKYGSVKIEVKHKGNWFYAYYECVMGAIAVVCFTHKPTLSELKKSVETL